MPIQYINRKGKKYYLHHGKTKTGKPKYYLSMKSEGNLADTIPTEFEIYENLINAHVVIRRCLPKVITDEEVNIVEQGLKELTELDYYIVDCKKNIISIYTVDQDVELLRETLELYNQNQQKNLSIEDLLKQTLSYSEHLQFILEDKEKRTFIARRYCYIGRVDDWIVIGSPDTLENLVKKYVKHLEQDSFFELI